MSYHPSPNPNGGVDPFGNGQGMPAQPGWTGTAQPQPQQPHFQPAQYGAPQFQQTPISYGAPQPPKKKASNAVKMISAAVVALLLVTIIVVGFNLFGDDAGPSGEPTGVPTTTPASTDPTTEPATTDPATTDPPSVGGTPDGTVTSPGIIGENNFTGTLDEGELTVAITTVNWNASDVVESENSYNDPPGDGMVYVLVTLSISYSGDGHSTPMYDLQVSYLAAGVTYENASVVIPDSIYDTNDLYDGGSVEANYAFLVPADTAADHDALIGMSVSYEEDPIWFAEAA